MERLRLPGSWRARLDLLAGVGAAAAAAGLFGLASSRDSTSAVFCSLYWLWLGGGAAAAGLRLVALLLERRGALEFVGEAEELALRTRRLLTVREALEPVRGRGQPEEPDDTPAHVKVFTALAAVAWTVALPAADNPNWETGVRFGFLWAAVVPSAAAAFFYAWHLARGAVRIVGEASED